MATINATISVSSTDLTSSTLALSNSMTMTKAGTNTGLEFTSGLVRRKLTAVTEINLIPTGLQVYGTPQASDATSPNTQGAAGKLYIKNTGSSSVDYVEIGLGDVGEPNEINDNTSKITIGHLYGGDWMLIPYHGKADVGDVLAKPSTAEPTTLEFMLFFE
jgi:hypothetical protein|tara:strand:- start:28 stop:510 length:483 start_codon:yes stop_codon:yes gene_type:complete